MDAGSPSRHVVRPRYCCNAPGYILCSSTFCQWVIGFALLVEMPVSLQSATKRFDFNGTTLHLHMRGFSCDSNQHTRNANTECQHCPIMYHPVHFTPCSFVSRDPHSKPSSRLKESRLCLPSSNFRPHVGRPALVLFPPPCPLLCEPSRSALVAVFSAAGLSP